jgi:SynChlorMet cassette protein ScmC
MHTAAPNPILSQKNHTLNLADGSSWTIVGKDKGGADISRLLAKTMRLYPASPQTIQKLLILSKSSTTKGGVQPIFSEKTLKSILKNKKTTCQLATSNDHLAQVIQLLELSQIFCSKTEEKGGVSIHGALAEKNGNGIILAGRGDVGKTTASRRLPAQWHSLSDDSSLIVLDKQNNYRAHPWPTWSSLATGGEIQTWDVQFNVPLKAVFILNQSKTDKVEQLGKGHAVCLLNEVVDQAWWGLDARLRDKEKQTLRLQRFDNICKLVKTIPTYLLHISKNGSFWKEIEKVLPQS